MRRTRRTGGFTLIEVMVAVTILVLIMAIAWGTVVQTQRSNRRFGGIQDRYREARTAMARIVSDIEMAYFSGNEDRTSTELRTFFIADSSGDVNSLRFSAFAHTRLFADANESDQTIIAYFPGVDPVDRRTTVLMRRETRRMPHQERWDSVPGEADVLFNRPTKLKFSFYDWREKEWKDGWSTQGVDASSNRMPDRVRISLSFLDEDDKEVTLTTQARVYMQEMIQSYAN